MIFDFHNGNYIPRNSERGKELQAIYHQRADEIIAARFAELRKKRKEPNDA